MPYRLYVSVSGGAVDYDAFQAARGAALGGTVRTYKRVRKSGGPVEVAGKYWASRIVEVEYLGDVGAAILDLLGSLKPTLLQLKADPGVRIWVSQIQDILRLGDAHGTFLMPEMVSLMAEIGAGLDFNISRRIRLSNANARS